MSSLEQNVISSDLVRGRYGIALPGTVSTASFGTHGDIWDTQWDMFCATIGATCSVLVLSREQDRQIASRLVG